MTLALAFAIIMLLLLLFGWGSMQPAPGNLLYLRGFPFIVWVLFFLLGWQVFGPLLHR